MQAVLAADVRIGTKNGGCIRIEDFPAISNKPALHTVVVKAEGRPFIGLGCPLDKSLRHRRVHRAFEPPGVDKAHRTSSLNVHAGKLACTNQGNASLIRMSIVPLIGGKNTTVMHFPQCKPLRSKTLQCARLEHTTRTVLQKIPHVHTFTRLTSHRSPSVRVRYS